jgi:D-tyrosyl-tRNA(Tyr) deacylase
MFRDLLSAALSRASLNALRKEYANENDDYLCYMVTHHAPVESPKITVTNVSTAEDRSSEEEAA